MSAFCCPVCRGQLMQTGQSLVCPDGHSFDLARQGYVNLLLSNQPASKRHGDDRLMVRARQEFLEKGFYQPVLDGIVMLLNESAPIDSLVLDSGCGEGWYTAGIARALSEKRCRVCGIDISKEAVKAAAGRKCSLALAVASAAHIPVPDGSCGVVLNLFSPLETEEYARVLQPGGILLRTVPLENHLMTLKAAIYDHPYSNDPPSLPLPGFSLLRRLDIRRRLELQSSEDIQNLFAMTPYYYKTSQRDQQKLLAMDRLTTELEIALLCYRKEETCGPGTQS